MAEERAKRKLTAILSADVEGYSRLMEDNEEATIRTLNAYRASMSALIKQHRGRVVDTTGDNLLSEFTSAVDAVDCAVEIQRDLAERNTELPYERKMEFRIGVNVGDVVEEDDRIYGDGVNIAARVEGLAEAGGICISGRAYDQVANKIGLEYENLGEHQVKNIQRPIRVYRVLSFPGAAAHRVVQAKEALGRRWRKIALSIVAVAVVVVVAFGIWKFYLRRPSVEPATVEKMAYPLPNKPSIAVLPFDNLSGDPEHEYIADGISENIITALSKIPKLFVIARNSTFTYKRKPVKVQKISEDLGVRYVLEGSVQKSGERLRITAQLIDAIKGHHLWSERYDRDLREIFALQDEITMKIITEMQVKLTEGEQARALAKGTDNLEAYLKVLEGAEHNYHYNKEANVRAKQLFEEALALDPQYATAYYGLSATHMFKVYFGLSKSPRKSLERATELVQKAIALDDSLAGPHGLLGHINTLMGQHEKAIAESELGVSLEPNSADNYAFLGIALRYANRPEEAIPLFKKAIRLNPISPSWYFLDLGMAYNQVGKFAEAISTLKRALPQTPDNLFIHLGLAYAYIVSGREEEARASATEVLRIDPKFSLDKLEQATATNIHYKEPFSDTLRKAGLFDKPPLPLPAKPSIAILPFANISGDPKEDYLSDGITEQIITALSKTPQMLVIARNSVFTYKGKPVMVQQVSRELGVRYVLEGSVQRSGDRLRITAQLIDAKTGNHLWSERYDRDLKDLFDLQDDITLNVIMALQIKLTQGDVANLRGKGTDNLEAYLKVMKGIPQVRRYNKEGNEIGRRLYEEAIALDPTFANAYVGLAWTYFIEANVGWAKTPEKSYEKAIELAKKAISLDELNAGAYMLFASVYAKTGQFEKAMAERKKGLSLDPESAYVNFQYGFALYNAGKFKEAIKFFKKAIRIDPKPPGTYLSLLGLAYFFTDQNEEAIAASKKCISREPSNADGHASLGLALIAEGKPEEAIAMFEKALNINPDGQWYVGNFAVARLGAGQPEEAITTLREVLGRDPENAEVCRLLSFLLTCEGKYAEALSMAKKAIDLKHAPEAFFYWSLAVPYCLMGQYEEAIAAYKKSISLWPEYVSGHIGLTASYSLAGRMEEARVEAAEVLRINPKISLESIARSGYYNFKKADKELFINALHKAGLM